MVNLTKLARDRDCLIRVPGHCCGDSSSVVGCHVRMIGISGAGLKADNLFIAWGCGPCHDVVDGRTKTGYSHDECRLMLLEGMVRTQAILIKEGVISW